MNEVLLGAGPLEVIVRDWRMGTIGTNKNGWDSLVHEVQASKVWVEMNDTSYKRELC